MGLFRRKNRRKQEAEPAGQQTGGDSAQARVPPRNVAPEARPNPDQPGWGLTAGQAIGKARQDRQEMSGS
jgi:hypothetical protein